MRWLQSVQRCRLAVAKRALEAFFTHRHRGYSVALRDPDVERYRSALDDLESRTANVESALFQRNVSEEERAVDALRLSERIEWQTGRDQDVAK